MACVYKYKGKSYDKDDFMKMLLSMSPSEASKFMPGVDNVVDAPLIKRTSSYLGLAMKRMIRYAAENGFDAISWTTGEQQAERYNLSKQIDEIAFTEQSDGGFEVYIYKDGSTIHSERNIKSEKLADLVGKEIAENIVKQKNGTLSGLDLKVGGEGMKSFYNKMLPSTTNKIIKKYGSKVGVMDFGDAERYDANDGGGWIDESSTKISKQLGFPVTDKMRDAAVEEGMPLFQAKSVVPEDSDKRTGFEKWTKGYDVLEGYELAEAPSASFVAKLHHGTTHKFRQFDPTITGNKEGAFGAVNYFTSDQGDADINYAGEGPDLTNRIEFLAEQIEDGYYPEHYNIDPDEASAAKGNPIASRQLATEALSGEEPTRIDVYVRLDNPVFVNGRTTTWIDNDIREQYREDAIEEIKSQYDATDEQIADGEFDDQIEEYIDESSMYDDTPIHEAIEDAMRGYDIQAYDGSELAYEPEVSATKLYEELTESMRFIKDPDTGSLVSTHVIGQVFKNLGYDGIVLQNADKKFHGMSMGYGTSHVHVFEETPSQIKSQEQDIETGAFSEDTGDIFKQAYTHTPAQESLLSKIGKRKKPSIRERYDELKLRASDKLRQGMVDQFHSLNKILKDPEAWMMAHLTKSDTGVLMTAINTGTPVHDESGAIDVIPDSKSVKDIFVPLGDQLDDFLAWFAAHRANKLAAEDRENLFTAEEIAEGMQLDRGREELFNTAKEEFEALGAAITDIAVKTDLVNAEEAQQWREEGWYVPFYRMIEEQASGVSGPSNIQALTNQKAYKKLKGGTAELEDLLSNVLMNWNHLISAGLRNQAGKKALETAVEMDLAIEVPKELKSKNAVYVRENGKEVWYETANSPEGRLVLDSLMSLNYEGMNNPAMKGLRLFKRALTTGVTASPGFKLRNLIRDSLHAPAVTTASKNPWVNVRTGLKERAMMKRMGAGGGAFVQEGYRYGTDPDATKALVGVTTDTMLDSPGKLKRMWRKYEAFGTMLENVNRVASFEEDLAAGKTLLEANFNSRDQMDFARSGSFPAVRVLSQTVPFLNARLQGLDKITRAAMDKDQQRQFAQVVGMYSLASVALMLAMMDDPDYEEAEEWEKRTYHMFKIPGFEDMYRIPRPFEVGAIAYMTEQMTKTFLDENEDVEDLASALKHTFSDTFAMNIVPQAFKPIVELYANKNMFTGRDIETTAMKRFSKKERAQPWTSKTTQAFSGGMSELFPESLTLSPVQTQHLIRAYTGWAGAQILASTDFLVKQMSGEVPPEVKLSEYKWNPLETLSREAQTRNSKYITKFYDNLAVVSREWADIQKYREGESGKKITEKQRLRRKYRKSYNRMSKRFSELRKKEKRIYMSEKLTARQKREQIKAIRKRRNAQAKRMVEMTDKYF